MERSGKILGIVVLTVIVTVVGCLYLLGWYMAPIMTLR